MENSRTCRNGAPFDAGDKIVWTAYATCNAAD